VAIQQSVDVTHWMSHKRPYLGGSASTTRPSVNTPLCTPITHVIIYVTKPAPFYLLAVRVMLVGYARVSTGDQTLDLQKDALAVAECGQVFTDVTSGAKSSRPGLDAALTYVRQGDTIVIWRLDRLGRSLQHLIDTVSRLEARGIGFRSLTEAIDTTTPGGKLIFHIFASLAEFERALIQERTNAGLAAACVRGWVGG
jgi:DNA invertase Pin-like site-specific DNA recombinase